MVGKMFILELLRLCEIDVARHPLISGMKIIMCSWFDPINSSKDAWIGLVGPKFQLRWINHKSIRGKFIIAYSF